MAHSMFSPLTITRLDGSNYVSWSTQCSLLLRREGLWGVVTNPPNVANIMMASSYDNKKPNLDYLHVFGTPAQVRAKGEHRARQIYFVGYESNHRKFRFWGKGTKNIYCSANALFQEHLGWEKIETNAYIHSPTITDFSGEKEKDKEKPVISFKQEPLSGEAKEENEERIISESVSPVLPRRSTRDRQPPERFEAGLLCQVDIEPSRSKHTDLRYLNVRQCIKDGLIVLNYCSTDDNIADHFTKAQSTVKHKLVCELYGLKL